MRSEDDEDDRGETRFQVASLAVMLIGFGILFAVEFWAALQG